MAAPVSQESTAAAAAKRSVPPWREIVKEARLLGTPGDEGDGGYKRDCTIIGHFLLYVLNRWGAELDSREEQVARSILGRQETLTYRQTLGSIKPLLDRLDSYTCSHSMRLHLVHIVQSCVDGDYTKATNAYMEMSIGNAPWPVGVTRSGIHQRPASAKAYANEAHALNDETTRKYIHAVKRLMTKCQTYFPSDLSKRG